MTDGAQEKFPGKFYDYGGAVFNAQHLDYGAVGNGTTDDLAAVHSAIAAAPSGSTVVLPATANGYATSATLVIDKPITLLGGTTTGGITGSLIVPSVSVSPVIKVTSDDVKIKGIFVKGFQAADTAIILNTGLSHILIEDVITHTCGIGLQMSICILSEFRNNSFVNGVVRITSTSTSLLFSSCFPKSVASTTYGAFDVNGDAHYINFISCGTDLNEGVGYWIHGNAECINIIGCGAEQNKLGFARVEGDSVGIINCIGVSNGEDLDGSTHTASAVVGVGAQSLSVIGFDDLTPSDAGTRLANVHLNSGCADCHIRGGAMDKGVRDQGSRNTIWGVLDEQNSARATALGYQGNVFVDNVVQTDVATLADDATPSVLNGAAFKTGGTTSITDFDDGVVGQEITILAEHTVTITDGTPIVLNGSGNFVMAATDTLTLKMFNNQVWSEVARSDNS